MKRKKNHKVEFEVNGAINFVKSHRHLHVIKLCFDVPPILTWITSPTYLLSQALGQTVVDSSYYSCLVQGFVNGSLKRKPLSTNWTNAFKPNDKT